MANNGQNNDDDRSRVDLTRIEDLSEFEHVEDADLELKFNDFNSLPVENEGLLPDLPDLEASLPEIPDNVTEEFPELQNETSDPFSDYFENNDETNVDFGENFDFSSESVQNSTNDLIQEEIIEVPADFNDEKKTSIFDRNEINPPESFEEVKNFAQNFSYGQSSNAGNPPFSIIIRNIKYLEEKEDILSILNEFGLVDDKNMADTLKAIELGSLLLPQISEYCAIVVAHKLRRFDCDIEMGLSDEVHPSKSGEKNPKGLIKKENLYQNKTESFKGNRDNLSLSDIIVSTTPTLSDYIILKYIGVQSSFAIIDEDELKRLNHVQMVKRRELSIQNYQTDESPTLTSEKAYNDFQEAFDFLIKDLADQLKARAFKENANALLGLNYQLNSLQLEKNNHKNNCYQLTCSATMARVRAI